MTPEQGKLYEFQLTNGDTLILRFDGFGQWMRPIWLDMASGETLVSPPPYVSVKQVG